MQVWFFSSRWLRARLGAFPRLALQAAHSSRLLPVPTLLWTLQTISNHSSSGFLSEPFIQQRQCELNRVGGVLRDMDTVQSKPLHLLHDMIITKVMTDHHHPLPSFPHPIHVLGKQNRPLGASHAHCKMPLRINHTQSFLFSKM